MDYLQIDPKGGRRLLGPSADAIPRHVRPAAHFVWRRYRLGAADVFPAQLAEAGNTEEAHRDRDLVLEDLKHPLDAFLARCRHSPALELADRDRVRAERNRLDNVAASLKTPIDN